MDLFVRIEPHSLNIREQSSEVYGFFQSLRDRYRSVIDGDLWEASNGWRIGSRGILQIETRRKIIFLRGTEDNPNYQDTLISGSTPLGRSDRPEVIQALEEFGESTPFEVEVEVVGVSNPLEEYFFSEVG